MSFWGLNDTGKNAKGRLGEIPNWLYDQMKQGIERGNENYDFANGLKDPLAYYYKYAMDNGLGTPEDIRAYGERAMPGVDTLVNNRNSRLQQITDAYGNVPSAQSTSELLKGLNNNNLNTQMRAIEGAYSTMYGRQDEGYNATTGNIADRLKATGKTYGDAQTQLNRLLPGGDFQAASSARSFAPALAAANRRLRASGIDPNSPEANNLLQRVEADRARSADDIYARNYGDYVNQGIGLRLGQLGDENALNAETRDRTMQMENAKTLLDQNSLDRRNALSDISYQREADNTREGRDMALADWENQSNLKREAGDNDLLAMNLLNQQYGMGVQGVRMNRNQQNYGASGLGNLMGQQYGVAQNYDQSAQNAASSAFNQYGQDYGVEQQNAGWGAKMLANLGLAAGSMIPGVGPFIGALGGAALGGSPMGGGQGGYGGYPAGGYGGPTGYGTPPFIPQQQGGGYANPTSPYGLGSQYKYSSGTRAPRGGYYSGTTTLPDGSLQVNR